MSAIQSNDEAASDQELRLRLPQQPEKPQQTDSIETARQTVIDLNKAEESKTSKEKKTYGRTPNGTVFVVPETHDMVSDLFDPREPKNVSDAIVLAVLTLKVATVVLLPTSITIPVFAALFLFWRAMYNGGIGYVLMEQSNFNSVVAWAKTNGIFEKPDSGNNKYAQYYGLLKRELETKIPKDYKFDEAPLEYNT